MATIPEALDLAVRHHQAGNLQQAEQVYLQVLQVDPQNAAALHLLGLIAHQVGRHDIAIDHIRAALRLAPDFAEAHNNLGVALVALGKPEEAVASYQVALRLKPDYAAAHQNLGIALAALARHEEAAASYRQAVALRPDHAQTHHGLGIALASQGKMEEAAASFQQSLRLEPGLVEAHLNLGVALLAVGKLPEAVASNQQALRLKPDFAAAHMNLGVALAAQRKMAEAVASYQEALRLVPDYAEAHHRLGMAWLSMGRFEQGWPEFQWRIKCKNVNPTRFRQPLWDGSPLDGRTILLHADEGLGDTLQFVRFARLVRECGGRVLVACPLSLFRLLATCAGIDRVISGGPLPDFDVYLPLLSVPGILGTTLATVPANVPYLHADPELTHYWRAQFSERPTFKIGIAWQGNPAYPNDHNRSFPLEHFAPLAALERVELISLQRGRGIEQMHTVAGRFPVTDLGSQLGDFMDDAAVVQNLDLVITADTALGHLAGAVGARVWIAMPLASDWRWLLNREDTPWYPMTRLFRQKQWGNWEEVFERIVGEVFRLLQ